MLEHTFRRVVLRNGERSKVKLAVDFAEEGYGLLSVFMASEVPNFWREIMAEVRPVADGYRETGEFRGNRCRLIVFRRLCVLMDGLGEEGLPLCRLATEDLISLMEEWLEERER